MRSLKTIYLLLVELVQSLSRARIRQLNWLLILMLIASLSEVISIGAVLPFLAVLIAPERILENSSVIFFTSVLGIVGVKNLLLTITIIFGAAALVTGAIRLYLVWSVNKLTFTIGSEISSEIYRRTLYQPYLVHVDRNSSEIISAITGKVNNVIYSIILPALVLVSSSFIIIIILFALIMVNPYITLATLLIFISIYFVIMKLSRSRLRADGIIVVAATTQVIKMLQEGLGAIRDVLIDQNQEKYYTRFLFEDRLLRGAQARSLFISQSPRYLIEAIAIILVASFAYHLSQENGGIESIIPILGVFALSAQRLLPVTQQLFSSWSNMAVSEESLRDVLLLLKQKIPEKKENNSYENLSFHSSICLVDAGFKYPGQSKWVIKNINLSIEKGSRLGIIGSTGSGKSTLLDILIGLIPPTSGHLTVDGIEVTSSNQYAWQNIIAYVPQSIYLSDGTISENIGFSSPDMQIDIDRVKYCAHQAQLSDAIEGWPQKYQTQVGERGIRLSGGQRQRIGIARALYKRAEIIVLDEATNALDSGTEDSVMQVIEGLGGNLTIIIVAHRFSTLKKCTEIIKIENGSIINKISYQDLIK